MENYAIQSGLANAGGIFYTAIKYSDDSVDGREARIYARDDGGLWDWGFRRDSGAMRAFFRHSADRDWLEADSDEDTWYIWELEFSPNQDGVGVHQMRYRWMKVGGTWSAQSGWKDDLTAGDGTIDALWLISDAAVTGYWDTITPTNPVSAGTNM